MKDMFWSSLPRPVVGSEFDDSKADDNNRIEAKSNRIYYYTEVSRGKNLSLNMKIQEMSQDLLDRASRLEVDVQFSPGFRRLIILLILVCRWFPSSKAVRPRRQLS